MSLLDVGKRVVVGVTGFCKSHAPEILLVGGTIAFGATIYAAVKESKKQDDINRIFEEEKRDVKIDHAKFDEEEYSKKEYNKDITGVYLRYVGRTCKNYAPAAGFAALSLTCFFSSYGILKKRNIALVAAYTTVSEAFRNYRARVVEKEGEEADFYYLSGNKMKTVTTTDENGNKKKERIAVGGEDAGSLYSFKFGKYKADGTRNYQYSTVDPLFNEMYIRGQMNYLTDELYLRTKFDSHHNIIQPGVVFLNDIREVLGEDRTMVGQVVGNLYSPSPVEGHDGYMNFNAVKSYEIDPETGKEIECWFIYPNIDGYVANMLDIWKDHKSLPVHKEDKFYSIERDPE